MGPIFCEVLTGEIQLRYTRENHATDIEICQVLLFSSEKLVPQAISLCWGQMSATGAERRQTRANPPKKILVLE